MKLLRAPILRPLMLGAAFAAGEHSVVGQVPAKRPNPASKLYVSETGGEARIRTGEITKDLTKRAVYRADGAVIETQKVTGPGDAADHVTSMVYSNGTGASFDPDTRVEIRHFVQEPFVPTRADSDVEPSISQTRAFVARGTVGLCTSKLVAGSTMTYSTPLGSVNIRGRKVVIQAEPNVTRVSMLEGESTVQAGTMDMGGHTVHAGEQAIIRARAGGQPNTIEIVKIPPAEATILADKASLACIAKKTVYFEVRERPPASAGKETGAETETTADAGAKDETGSNSDAAASAPAPDAPVAARADGEISIFNADKPAPPRTAGGPFTSPSGEIVAIPLVPASLPVQFVVSPAALVTPAGHVVTPGNPPAGQGGPPGN